MRRSLLNNICNDNNVQNHFFFFTFTKGSVELIKWVKIAHSFLQSVLNQFHVIILSLPM